MINLSPRFLSLGKIARTAINRNIVNKPTIKHQFNTLQFRSYIRPHYYQNDQSLSKALKEQQNPFNKIGRVIDSINPNIVLWGVIGTNVGIYLLWQYAINSYKTFHDTRWLNIMSSNFISSYDAVREGRIHTLLASAFSHKSLEHLGLNMLVLYSIGQGVLQAIGSSRFLLLYAGAGVTASIAGLLYKQYIRPSLERQKYGRMDSTMSGSMGASGSVMGITTFFACAFPKSTFLVFFIVPMPAVAVVGLFAAYDMYKAYTLNSGIVDSAGHLGGAAYGAAYWFLRVKPMMRAGRWRF